MGNFSHKVISNKLLLCILYEQTSENLQTLLFYGPTCKFVNLLNRRLVCVSTGNHGRCLWNDRRIRYYYLWRRLLFSYHLLMPTIAFVSVYVTYHNHRVTCLLRGYFDYLLST